MASLIPRINIDIQAPELSDRALGRARKAAGLAVAEEHLKNNLPGRFDGSMARKLKYEERDESWQAYKEEIGKDPKRDHYYRGKAEKRAKRATPKVTKKRISIKIDGLNPGYGRRRSPTKPDMASELKRITAGELKELSRIYGETFVVAIKKELAKARKKRKV